MSRLASREKDDATCADGQSGPVEVGSGDVFINSRGAARREDTGHHVCDAESFHIIEGVALVLVNHRPLAAVDHATMHPHGNGKLIAGAANVLVDGATANFIDDTRADAIDLIDKALESIDRWDEADRARFREWFGDDSEAARQEMRKKYQALKDKLLRVDFKDAASDNYAFVYKDGNTVNLGKKFWTAPRFGEDSKGGVLVHESSHFSDAADTGDTGGDNSRNAPTVYGRPNARTLATKNPTGARQNADNVEYFAETAP
jgi:uncharacterized Zn-binding protein involved in type VI secretion